MWSVWKNVYVLEDRITLILLKQEEKSDSIFAIIQFFEVLKIILTQRGECRIKKIKLKATA